MKTAESKPATSATKASSPFFSKEGGHALSGPAFFNSTAAESSFFSGHQGSAIQAKLSVGQPNDPYEKEADATADKVVHRLANPGSSSENGNLVQASPLASTISRFVQKKCAACEQEEKLQKAEEKEDIQTKPIFESNEKMVQHKCAACEKEEQLQKKSAPGTAAEPSSDVESYLSASKGNGSSLPAHFQTTMESTMGADFSKVRIHNDSSASRVSDQLHAQAFTHGSDIYFSQGKYDTGSPQGKHLLAHELTHVIQQGSAGVQNRVNRVNTEGQRDNPPAPDAIPDNLDPKTIEDETQKDIDNDSLGGIKAPDEDKDEDKDEDENDPGGNSPETDSGEEGGSDAAGGDTGPNDKDLKSDEGGDQADPKGGDSTVTIPEGTPAAGKADDKCPTIAPEFPEPSSNTTLEEDQDSFFKELISFVSSDISSGPSAIMNLLGQGAYLIWRQLPLWIKVKAINVAIDKIIAGAYWGKLIGPYVGVGTGLISAAMTGFFKRLRKMDDVQKVRLFEKFGKIVVGGDSDFTLGLLKGLLIGFFLDGVLSIVQMVIDVVCIVPKIINFFRTIGDFIKKVPYEIQLLMINIQLFFASIGDAIANAYKELTDLIKNPSKIVEMVKNIYEAAAGQAEKLGDTMADSLIRYAALPSESLGTIAGRIGGKLLFEGLLTYFTGGGEAAVNVVKVALREIGAMLARIGKAIFQIIKRLGEVFSFIRNIISKIIKFLTPLLKVVARLARRVIDKIKELFNLFRRMCKPGSIVCKVKAIKPNCEEKHVPRLGFNPFHDSYVTRTTGQTMDYKVKATYSKKKGAIGATCNFDAKLPGTRLLIEGKTGYRYLPYLGKTNPSKFRLYMLKLEEQRIRCGLIALGCGYLYTWYMQDRGAANFLDTRWHGFPPVLHRP
ncbi:MAG: hypothetical protein BGO55_03605 [Sphingobacteriales bacterium 50-39]|nr:DUF4157 domain-containing protein [Sphingobacteriales bacterium]OJW55635.1 MAG: hypothetical protein BGO55_03605 [Sphingobacteriales bacterium 50-39]